VIRSDNFVACWGYPTGINGNRSGTQMTSPTLIENTTDTVSLSVGNEQSCVAKGDGTVWCWGHVFHGEAGWVATGTTTTRRSSAVQMTSLSSIVQVTQSANSACGRRANGDVLCWGEASVGQLGDGTYQPRGIAAYVRITWQTNPYAARVAKLSSAGWQTCAILTDRRVACWGSKHPWWSNKPETTLEPGVINGLTDVVDIIAGWGNSCALKRDGTVWCWGIRMITSQFVNGVQTSDIPQMHIQRDVIALSSGIGNNIRCLTAMTGGVTCYKNDAPGDISAYQLPTGNTISSDVGKVEHGYLSSCYLKQSNGEVWCWGDNTYYSQLGNGISNIQSSDPRKVNGLGTVQQLATGDYASCAILADTSVKCWGQAIRIDGVNGGAAGTRGTSEYPTPIAIPNTTGMRKIASGWGNCGIKFDGTVWCWGVKRWVSWSASTNAGMILEGALTPWQVMGISNAVDINQSSSWSVCVLLQTGDTRCWGEGANGELGNGTNALNWIPRPISEPWQANVNQGCEWVDWQGRRHFYESLSGNWTWTQARDIAAARTWRGNSGYLATITSPEENRCVHQLLLRQENTNSGFNGWYPGRWLGGSDAESEGTWKWMTGPETGTTFREIQRTNYPQAGFSQFQTMSGGGQCKPNCATPTNWDYTRMIFPYGTYIQRNQWDDQSENDSLGALVEYTTSPGESARTYTTTTDSQGNYRFDGLAPGVYTVQSTVHDALSTQRVVIWPDQRDERVDLVNRSVTTSLRQTMTAQPTATRTATGTVTKTSTPTSTPYVGSAWNFDDYQYNSAVASSASISGDNVRLTCGTDYGSYCPFSARENGDSYLLFNGTQYMRGVFPLSETEMIVTMRFRTMTSSGEMFAVTSEYGGVHDRYIYLSQGKVCAYVWSDTARYAAPNNTTETICTSQGYDDNKWHTLTWGIGGSFGRHLLQVDSEVIRGQMTRSGLEWDILFRLGKNDSSGFVGSITDFEILPRVTEYRVDQGCFWVDNNGLKHRYELIIHDRNVTWQAAHDAAIQRRFNGISGYLATITHPLEDACIRSMLKSRLQQVDAHGAWIGANDYGQLGVWRWVTGPESGTLVNPVVFPWEIGQPNPDGERCVGYMYRGNKLGGNDYPCEGYNGLQMSRYIVEYTTMGNELTP
jgi:alpha-tubulin suppressor-like RCC1 family protein